MPDKTAVLKFSDETWGRKPADLQGRKVLRLE